MILFFYMEFQDGNSYIKTRNLVKQYGKRRVVKGVNIDLRAGEIVGLLGPNGAGKTTVFNLLTKVYQPTRGTILLDGMGSAQPENSRLSTNTIGANARVNFRI